MSALLILASFALPIAIVVVLARALDEIEAACPNKRILIVAGFIIFALAGLELAVIQASFDPILGRL